MPVMGLSAEMDTRWHSVVGKREVHPRLTLSREIFGEKQCAVNNDIGYLIHILYLPCEHKGGFGHIQLDGRIWKPNSKSCMDASIWVICRQLVRICAFAHLRCNSSHLKPIYEYSNSLNTGAGVPRYHGYANKADAQPRFHILQQPKDSISPHRRRGTSHEVWGVCHRGIQKKMSTTARR